MEAAVPENSYGKLVLVLLVGFLLRLLALPLMQVANGDAVGRVFIAWQGLSHPLSYLKGGWGPLHFFLIAAALRVWFNTVYSPIFLHILFSIFTAIPLYAFVKREWTEPAAFYVAAASLLYPIAFRQSYMPISEVPFAFFVMCSLNRLSLTRHDPRARHAIVAGLLLTLAAALRMEAWILIPLFTLLLRKNGKLAALFLCFSLIFPIFSVTSNYLTAGDPFPALTASRVWQLQMEGINENLTPAVIAERLLFFPAVLLFGMTPLLFALCAGGAFFAIRNRKSQAEWIVPFAVLLCIFLYQAARGLLTLQARYALILGYLLLPFAAEAIERFREKKSFKLIMVVILASMLPLSYVRVVTARVMGPSFPNPFPADLEAIPKVSRSAVKISKALAGIKELNRGALILDFIGWKETSYIALMTKIEPWKIWSMPGGKYQPFDAAGFSKFVTDNPTGIMMRSANSPLIALRSASNRTIAILPGISFPLYLQPLESVEDVTIYQYSTR